MHILHPQRPSFQSKGPRIKGTYDKSMETENIQKYVHSKMHLEFQNRRLVSSIVCTSLPNAQKSTWIWSRQLGLNESLLNSNLWKKTALLICLWSKQTHFSNKVEDLWDDKPAVSAMTIFNDSENSFSGKPSEETESLIAAKTTKSVFLVGVQQPSDRIDKKWFSLSGHSVPLLHKSGTIQMSGTKNMDITEVSLTRQSMGDLGNVLLFQLLSASFPPFPPLSLPSPMTNADVPVPRLNEMSTIPLSFGPQFYPLH